MNRHAISVADKLGHDGRWNEMWIRRKYCMLKGGAESLWSLYVDMTSQKEELMSVKWNQFNVCFMQNVNRDRILNCIKKSTDRFTGKPQHLKIAGD